MPGKPGAGGPVPKRSTQRRRANKPTVPIDSAPRGSARVAIPRADADWHPAALRWYRSLARSGQSHWYEPSDWAQAYVWAEVLSRALGKAAPPAMLVAAWASGAAELLTTEGARRRMRIELARAGSEDEDEEAAVAALDDYRARFSG